MKTKDFYKYEKARLVQSSDFADSVLEQSPAVGKLTIDISKQTALFVFDFGDDELSLDLDLSGGVQISAPTAEGELITIYEVNEKKWVFIAEVE